ncbi:transposase [Bradyrhizobium sp. C-145]|uniref:IS66 family transposase n=1 Tax=Bradyrhizobium sp. C-145 TaxID=574727 RepID=UPI00201B71D6|nr:transposase [Bradyrhizobium sp. C-145]UQR65447.1 transposase [Bradyrhizobium sp. C-145]
MLRPGLPSSMRSRPSSGPDRRHPAERAPSQIAAAGWGHEILLEAQLAHIPPRNSVADAIRYALARWDALCRFVDDGRIELDTNTVERAIRPIALGRKNHPFARSDGGADRWATVCSLLTTAKLNDVEPFSYLQDVLERISIGHPITRLDELLPWNWRPPTVVNGHHVSEMDAYSLRPSGSERTRVLEVLIAARDGHATTASIEHRPGPRLNHRNERWSSDFSA